MDMSSRRTWRQTNTNDTVKLSIQEADIWYVVFVSGMKLHAENVRRCRGSLRSIMWTRDLNMYIGILCFKTVRITLYYLRIYIKRGYLRILARRTECLVSLSEFDSYEHESFLTLGVYHWVAQVLCLLTEPSSMASRTYSIRKLCRALKLLYRFLNHHAWA